MPETSPNPARERSPSLAARAVRGALWTVATSAAARALGLAGTLLLTRFLDPDEYGEVSLAAIVIMTAGFVSSCGLSQYIVSKPGAGREAAFHATFYFTLLGLASLAIVLATGGLVGDLIHAPGMARFLPGLALATVLERVATIQDRILVRDMRWRDVGLVRSLGEVVYTVASVALAAAGQGAWWGGGNAVVIASIARSAARLVALGRTTPRREWLEPCRITWARTRDLFAFGAPMSLASIAAFGSRKWDNLVYSHHFGQGPAGIYNLAYNIADVPASQIAETIGDVLVPSFAKIRGDAERRAALLVSMRQMTLLVAPLALGLGAIAPSIAALLDPRWASIAPLISVLSVLSIVRPIGWIGSSYLQVADLPRTIMILEIAKPFALIALMHAFAIEGPRALGAAPIGGAAPGEILACSAVGVVFAVNAWSYMWALDRRCGLALSAQIAAVAPPVFACAPMLIAVLALDRALAAAPPPLRLAVEIAAGAAVFVPSALVLAPAASRELVALVRAALADRRPP